MADNKEPTHWYYKEADIFVEMNITQIPGIDNANNIKYNGSGSYKYTTLLRSNKPYTIEEYHSKYGIFLDGKWYYNKYREIQRQRREYYDYIE